MATDFKECEDKDFAPIKERRIVDVSKAIMHCTMSDGSNAVLEFLFNDGCQSIADLSIVSDRGEKIFSAKFKYDELKIRYIGL